MLYDVSVLQIFVQCIDSIFYCFSSSWNLFEKPMNLLYENKSKHVELWQANVMRQVA